MNLSRPGLILTLGCCLLFSPSLRAEDAAPPFEMSKQFSAEQVITTSNGPVASKIFMDNGKVRSEMTMAGMQIVSIVRPDLKKVYSVMDAQKMVMEMPYDPRKVQQTASGTPEGKFEAMGPETIENIACTKYKITAKDGKVAFMWIDAASKTPVKMAAEDNSYSVIWKNYKPGPQVATLFEPPAGYQKMAMPAVPGAGGAPAPPPAPPASSDAQ